MDTALFLAWRRDPGPNVAPKEGLLVGATACF